MAALPYTGLIHTFSYRRICKPATVLNIPNYQPTPLPAQQAACHECDLLNNVPELEPGHTASCERCGSTLYKNPRSGIENSLALGFASLLMFISANLFPFLNFGKAGQSTQTYLYSAVLDLYGEQMYFLSGVVLFTCILAPLLLIGALLTLLVPLYIGRKPPKIGFLTRTLSWLEPWAMLDVFMIGILVSIVKLIKMANITPGISFWAFVVLTFTVVGATALLQPRVVWHRYREITQ